jgi:hypothetical protein
MTPEREARVLAALSERLSIAAVARMFSMSRQTVYDVLKKSSCAPAPLTQMLLELEHDALEVDELCISKRRNLWLWVAVSRYTGKIVAADHRRAELGGFGATLVRTAPAALGAVAWSTPMATACTPGSSRAGSTALVTRARTAPMVAPTRSKGSTTRFASVAALWYAARAQRWHAIRFGCGAGFTCLFHAHNQRGQYRLARRIKTTQSRL